MRGVTLVSLSCLFVLLGCSHTTVGKRVINPDFPDGVFAEEPEGVDGSVRHMD